MGLIHEKEVIALLPICKVPFQPHIRVEYIIVVTDDPVGPAGNIKAVLKRTDLIFFRVLEDLLSGHLLFQVKNVKHSFVDPVEMPLCIGTRVRVALALVHRTKLLLRRDRHGRKDQTMVPQNPECLLRHGPRHSLCGEIKKLITLSFPDGPNRREHRGERFSDSRGRLNEQAFFPAYCPVDSHYKIPLPGTVRKRKFQLPDRRITGQFVIAKISRPFKILVSNTGKPDFQFFPRTVRLKPFDLLCLKVAVGHLKTDPVKILFTAVEISVTHRLGEMYFDGGFQPRNIRVHAFDLIDHGNTVFLKDPVGTSLHEQRDLLLLIPDLMF